MKTKLHYCTVLVIVATLFASCKKDKKEPQAQPDIYALLTTEGPSRLYKNGEHLKPTGLPDNFLIRDFDFIGDQLVIVGSTDNDAKVWLDGEVVSLGLNFSTERLRDLMVHGSSIYYLVSTETGFKYANASGSSWQNINHPEDKYFELKEIAIVEGKVTVFGTVEWFGGGSYRLSPAYWQEGKGFTIVNEDGGSYFRGVALQGSKIYIAGGMTDKAGYWDGAGIFKEVQSPGGLAGANVEDIAVSGGNVYLCGDAMGEVRRATSWKNGQPTFLSEETSGAVCMTIHGNDVYIGGAALTGVTWSSRCWINGKLYEPLSGTPNLIIEKIIVK